MIYTRARSVAIAVGLAVVTAACGSADGGDAGEAAASVTAADTTGAAIWAHIHESNYATDWQLWPEKGRLYTGREPHGMLLTTYLNDIAYQALTSGAREMPAGAVIVKENYMPDSTLAAVTTMLKVPGYNAEHNDWFFTKHLAGGELDKMPNGMEMEGRLPGCQTCHLGVRANDYLFTGQLGGGR
jgi:hypothetical protein